MKTYNQEKLLDEQLFYEVSINLSTIKSLIFFLDFGINKEVCVEDVDLSNITTLLKDIVDKTICNFEKIESDLRI